MRKRHNTEGNKEILSKINGTVSNLFKGCGLNTRPRVIPKHDELIIIQRTWKVLEHVFFEYGASKKKEIHVKNPASPLNNMRGYLHSVTLPENYENNFYGENIGLEREFIAYFYLFECMCNYAKSSNFPVGSSEAWVDKIHSIMQDKAKALPRKRFEIAQSHADKRFFALALSIYPLWQIYLDQSPANCLRMGGVFLFAIIVALVCCDRTEPVDLVAPCLGDLALWQNKAKPATIDVKQMQLQPSY